MIIQFEQSPESGEQTEIKATLLTHKLQVLKQLFYDSFNINVPKDIMYDIDYAAVNISQILTSYIYLKINKQSFNIKSKLFKCVYCFEWNYFKTAKKNICRSCYVIKIEPKVPRCTPVNLEMEITKWGR